MRQLLIILSFCVVFSCKNEKQETVAQKETFDVLKNQGDVPLRQPKKAFELETFGFPAEVSGCSCYLARNKADFEAEKFLYIDDYGKTAFIKVNGKIQKIPAKKTDFDPENFKKNVEGKGFKIKITGKKIEEMYEVMRFEGEMEVKNSDGETFTTPFYGECGC